MINQTCNANEKWQQTVKIQEQKTQDRKQKRKERNSRCKSKVKNYQDKRRKGQQKAIKKKKKGKKGKCEKGGITIMDQPINLPSQFISLRWRCVEIHRSKISLFGSRNHAKRPIPLYRRESLRLSIKQKNYFPSDRSFQSNHAE